MIEAFNSEDDMLGLPQDRFVIWHDGDEARVFYSDGLFIKASTSK